METDSAEAGTAANTAMIFPGITPTSFGDTAKFLLLNPAARDLVELADSTLGYSLIDRYRKAVDEYTEYSRMAFLLSCLALAAWAVEEHDLHPSMCAGLSFGGTPAAVYAGALSVADAVLLTAAWSRHLESYLRDEPHGVVTQSLARTPADRLREVLDELDQRGEWHDIAGYVDDDFHLVSVRAGTLDWLQARVRALGGLPLYTLDQPLHSSLFAPLRDRIEAEVFGPVSFGDPALPVVSDHDGSVLHTASEIRTLLLDAIVRPVRWPAVVDTLKAARVRRICVAGQDALWGRVPCTTSNFDVLAAQPARVMAPRRRAARAR